MHFWHTSPVLAPIAVEYRPAAHFEHAVALRCVLYVPLPQVLQYAVGLPKFSVKNPESHLQSVNTVLPAQESEFSWHASQTPPDVAANTPEYVPFGHRSQSCGPLRGLNLPA